MEEHKTEEKYLYGAAVQGIQNFLLQTNKLKDIVGASALVEQVCTTAFKEFEVDSRGKCVVMAAGNIKYIFDKKEDCEKTVKVFPLKVQQLAPGITISQAVVNMSKYPTFVDAVNELERRLRTQRNKLERSVTLGLMGIQRSRQTGLPVVEIRTHKEGKKEVADFLDEGTKCKLDAAIGSGKLHENVTYKLCDKSFGLEYDKKRVCLNITEMTRQNDWLAVIHADGNGLGLVVQKIGGEINQLSEFSKELDNATKEAAQKAYSAVIKPASSDKIPMRPIVLSGDDLTVICRADLAVDYATVFISEFEKSTQSKIGHILKDHKVFAGNEDYLTACAGITFIKSSYPYYYAYELAEALCAEAKKDAKSESFCPEKNSLPPSCIMFHKVQDSFVESYSDIVNRELTAQENIRFNFGPYYILKEAVKRATGRWTIDELSDAIQTLDRQNYKGLRNQLRQWIALLYEHKPKADQHLERILQLYGKQKDLLKLIEERKSGDSKKYYPTYDILSLRSIISQITK